MKQVVDSLELSNGNTTIVFARYSAIDYRIETWVNGKCVNQEKATTRKEASKLYASEITSQENKRDHVLEMLIGVLIAVSLVLATMYILNI